VVREHVAMGDHVFDFLTLFLGDRDALRHSEEFEANFSPQEYFGFTYNFRSFKIKNEFAVQI
jgi:hypothetical protein